MCESLVVFAVYARHTLGEHPCLGQELAIR